MKQQVKITQFLDDTGKITQLPSKQNTKLAVLEYLAEKFALDCTYSERQINEICDRWHTFGDYFLLRRELVDNGLLSRERDGSKYWRTRDDSSTNEEKDHAGNLP